MILFIFTSRFKLLGLWYWEAVVPKKLGTHYRRFHGRAVRRFLNPCSSDSPEFSFCAGCCQLLLNCAVYASNYRVAWHYRTSWASWWVQDLCFSKAESCRVRWFALAVSSLELLPPFFVSLDSLAKVWPPFFWAATNTSYPSSKDTDAS